MNVQALGIQYEKHSENKIVKYTSKAFTINVYTTIATLMNDSYPEIPITYDIRTNSIVIGGEWPKGSIAAEMNQEQVKRLN